MDLSFFYQCILIPLELALYAIVGGLIFRKFSDKGFSWQRLPYLLLLGFAATPLMTALIAGVLNIRLSWALLVFVCGLVLFHFVPLRRFQADANDSMVWPKLPNILLLFIVLFAIAVNLTYLPWSMEIHIGDGRFVSGENIFDLEKHMGVTLALAAHGMQPTHYAALGVDLLYYTGAYIVPAAFASVLSGEIVPVLVSHIIVISMLFALVAATIIWSLKLPQGHFGRLMRWLLFAVTLSGLSLEFDLYGVGKYMSESPTWSEYWTQWYFINGVTFNLFWLWQHASAVSAALIGLWMMLRMKSRFDYLLWTFLSAYVVCASTFLGISYYAVVILVTVCRLAVKRNAWAEAWRGFLRATLISCFFQGILCLPVYMPILIASLNNGLNESGMVLADQYIRQALAIFSVLGVGTLVLFLFPFFFRRALRWLPLYGYLLVTLIFALVMDLNYSDMGAKSLSAAQLVAPIVLIVTIASSIMSENGKVKSLGLVLLLAALVNAAIAANGAEKRVEHFMVASPKITSDELAAIKWVKCNTLVDDVVSMAEGPKTEFHYTLTRSGVSSGEDILPRLGYVNCNATQCDAYKGRAGDLHFGWLHSDYIYVPLTPYGLGLSRTGPAPVAPKDPEKALAMAEELGFRKVWENPACVIFRNPASRHRPSQADDAHPLPNEINLVDELVQEGEYGRALSLLDRMDAKDKRQKAYIHYYQAYCMHRSNVNLLQGKKLYDLALAEGFNEFWVRYNRGALLLQLGEKEKARADLLRAAEIDGEHEGVKQFLSLIDGKR